MSNNLKIRRLLENESDSLKSLILLFQHVFEEANSPLPSNSYLNKLLTNKNFLAFVAFKDDKIVGGITAYELQKYDSESSEIFVYDIAIDPEFHRLGLGKQLVSALTDYGKENGVQVIFVGAHEEDQHALDFYQATGGKGEKMVLFNYYPNN